MTPQDFQPFVDSVEQVLGKLAGDDTTLSADQAAIDATQQKLDGQKATLTTDQATKLADGKAAYPVLGAMITALQSMQATLPQPDPPSDLPAVQ